MCGRTYHYLPRSNSTGGLHHFIVDKYSEALSHAESINSANNKRLDTDIKSLILEQFWATLHEKNKFVQSCQILGKAVDIINNQNPEDDYLPAEEAFTPEVIAQINSINTPHLLDVASVTDDSIVGNRVIRFKLRGTKFWNKLPITHHHLEPLTYPILFIEGEDGWGTNISKEIHFPDYIVSRMLMPEEGLYVRNDSNTKWIPTNRFQLFARIAQYWLCDSVSRNIDCRLNWVKNNQNYIQGMNTSTTVENNLSQHTGGHFGFGGEADLEEEYQQNVYTMNEVDNNLNNQIDLNFESIESNTDDYDVMSRSEMHPQVILTPDQPGYKEYTGKTFLGSKFHGSRRHLRALSENGLIVVSEKGEPHLFITLTTNTEWPEIKEHLFAGQTAFDRYV